VETGIVVETTSPGETLENNTAKIQRLGEGKYNCIRTLITVNWIEALWAASL
jgi:hypothetical protein